MATAGEYDRMKERILRLISKQGATGATKRDLCKGMKDKTPSEIEAALHQLATAGEIEEVRTEPGAKGGRPTERYILVTE